MEGKNRRLAGREASKKNLKRAKAMFRPDEKASKGTYSVVYILCDFGGPQFVCKGRRYCLEAESRCGEEPRPLVQLSWGEILKNKPATDNFKSRDCS